MCKACINSESSSRAPESNYILGIHRMVQVYGNKFIHTQRDDWLMSPVFYTPNIPMPHFCKLCQLWYHEDATGGVCRSCWKAYKNHEYNQPSDYQGDEEE